MKEQISEEFAREIICNRGIPNLSDKEILRYWKLNGYIKQSREEHVRSKLDEIWERKQLIAGEKIDCDLIRLQDELIKILDNKLKGEK